eukprot:scaffold23606_cov25-Tisochrysis_lutea.AAC.5
MASLACPPACLFKCPLSVGKKWWCRIYWDMLCAHESHSCACMRVHSISVLPVSLHTRAGHLVAGGKDGGAERLRLACIFAHVHRAFRCRRERWWCRASQACLYLCTCAQGISLREEKMVVQNVSRLQALRGKLREFDSSQEQLQYAEGEAQKVRQMLWCRGGTQKHLSTSITYNALICVPLSVPLPAQLKAVLAAQDRPSGHGERVQHPESGARCRVWCGAGHPEEDPGLLKGACELEEMDEEEKEMTKAKNDAYEALQ